jgi:hypothetical protein
MLKAVLGSALLAGTLVLSPLGTVAAFANGTPAPGASVPACSVPTQGDLSISASTPAATDDTDGTAAETLKVTSDEDIVLVIDYTVSPPALISVPTPVMSWNFDGEGSDAGVFPGGTGGWREGTVVGQVQPGSHTLVLGFTFTTGMQAGSYSASFDWNGQQTCDDNATESPTSPTFTIPMPSLTYDPPSAAGGPGTSVAQPTSGGAAAHSSASPTATGSASAGATASGSSDSAPGAAAAAPSTAPSATGPSEGTVTLTTSAPTSSDSATVWMLVTVFVVMLVGSVASGSIIKRRRLALENAPESESESETDTGPDPAPEPDSDSDSDG